MRKNNLPLDSTAEGVQGASPAGHAELAGPVYPIGPHSTLQEVLDHQEFSPAASRKDGRRRVLLESAAQTP